MVSVKANANLKPEPLPEDDAAGKPRRILLAAAIFAALTLIVFSDVLFTRDDVVLSRPGADLAHQFVAWREFAFSQLRHGNFALWNPHIYSGTPFFGGFQSGLLYPPNYLYLLLPLAKAINTGIALHVFLAGFFMYLWASRRRLHFLACLLCGALWMFCGEHFLHIAAGHLDRLIATAWIPLVFLAIDGLFEDLRPRWTLLGIFAVSMMTLGGDPQYVFYTAVAAAIYCALRLVKAQKRLRIILGLAVICAGAAAITAVQLWTALEATAESVRGAGGLKYDFASQFSFPPENFLTLVAPGFFGDLTHQPYWGRGYLWEMCLFVSVCGFLLAVYGAGAGREKRRFSVTMALILLLLALGSYTPLFRLLYDFAPGFDRFRGMSKFAVQASAFIALLSGIGLDRLIRAAKVDRRLAAVPVALAAALLIAAVWIGSSAEPDQPSSGWRQTMLDMRATHEIYLQPEYYDDAAFARQAQFHASSSLLLAAIPCAIAAAGLLFLRSNRKAAYLLTIAAAGEMLVFALSIRPTFTLEDSRPAALVEFFKSHPGDERALIARYPDTAMQLGAYGIWGYSPLLPGRYAEFMFASQGQNPDEATPNLTFLGFPPQNKQLGLPQRYKMLNPIYRIFRCRCALDPSPDLPSPLIEQIPDPLPHAAIIRQYGVAHGRDGVFAAMSEQSFDPAKKVILESEPDPKPAPSSEPDRVEIKNLSTDALAIEADITRPAILLVTDNYDKAWRARALPGSSQSQYDVMPADYTLRAVPLAAGHHRILMEYSPAGFRIGRWISIIAAAAYLIALAWLLTVKFRGDLSKKGREP